MIESYTEFRHLDRIGGGRNDSTVLTPAILLCGGCLFAQPALSSFPSFRRFEGRLDGVPHARFEPDPPMAENVADLVPWARWAESVEQAVVDRPESFSSWRDLGRLELERTRPDSAVRAFSRCLRLRPGDAAIRNDLAVALLQRARLEGRPFDLVLALSAALEAVEIDPEPEAARFTLALCLELLHLRRPAIAIWEDVSELDPSPRWREEAASRRAGLSVSSPRDRWPARREILLSGRDPEDLARLAGEDLQAARELVLDELLPGWAEDPASRRGISRLRTAGLVVEEGSSELLRAALRHLMAADSADRGLVAAGIGHFVKARELEGRQAFAEARGAYREASSTLSGAGSPLHHWATFRESVCRFYQADYHGAEEILASLRSMVEIQGDDPLTGRILWVSGTIRLRQSDYEGALNLFRSAHGRFEKAGEGQNLAATEFLLAETLDELGRPEDAWAHRLRALAGLEWVRDPRRVHAILVDAAMSASRAGEARAASAFLDELVRFSAEWGHPVALSQAYLVRARNALRLGQASAARRDALQALSQAEKVGSRGFRDYLEADARLTLGELDLEDAPSTALEQLDRALALHGEQGHRSRFLRIERARSRALLSLGRRRAAESALLAAIEIAESERGLIGDPGLRSSYFDQVQAVYEELIRLRVGAEGAAFDIAERARARSLLDRLSERPVGLARLPERPLGWQGVRRALPPRAHLVATSVLGEELIAWRLDRGGLSSFRWPVTRDELSRDVDDLVAAVRSGQEVARPEWLEAFLASVFAAIPDGERAVLLLDEGLHRLPFAALPEPATGDPLLARLELVRAPSATLYLHGLELDRERRHAEPSLLAVAPGSSGSLPALRGAEEAVGALAEMYPSSEVLIGEQARPASFLSLAPEHSVIVFAGHARIDEESPLRSQLLFGSESLAAQDLYSLELAKTRLVVLAACSTSAGAVSRAEGLSSLVHSFLAAGVPSLVATLWPVDDLGTAELHKELQRRLLALGDPVRAFREAQLSQHLLEPRDPSTWAAFVLFGGGGPLDP